MAKKTAPVVNETAGGRAVWTGAIRWGLMVFGVKLYSATESHDISFKQVHRGCGGAIKYRRHCATDGAEVAFEDIDKGIDLGSGPISVNNEELLALRLDTLRTVEILEITSGGQVDPIYYENHYTLTPAGPESVAAYVLFMRALEKESKLALVKITLRTRESTALVHVRDGRLALTTLRWADEIRQMTPPTYPEPSQAELDMAVALLHSMPSTARLDLTQHEDHYKLALAELITRKMAPGLAGKEAPEPVAIATPTGELMQKLRDSVQAEVAKRKAGERKLAASKKVPTKVTPKKAPARAGKGK